MGEQLKYELMKEKTTEHKGHILYRIRALRDFGDVKAGTVGGYIEKESNLSQEGNCWVYDEAYVYGDVVITESAKVEDLAEVFGNVTLSGSATVTDSTVVYGHAKILDEAAVRGVAKVYGSATIQDKANVIYNGEVCGNAVIKDSARLFGGYVSGNAIISGTVYIRGHVHIIEDAQLSDEVYVRADSMTTANNPLCIGKETRLSGKARITIF